MMRLMVAIVALSLAIQTTDANDVLCSAGTSEALDAAQLSAQCSSDVCEIVVEEEPYVDPTQNVAVAFAMVTAAGLSTTIGAAFVFSERLVKMANKKLLGGSLGFSAGVMLYVSFIEIFYKGVAGFEGTFFFSLSSSTFRSRLDRAQNANVYGVRNRPAPRTS